MRKCNPKPRLAAGLFLEDAKAQRCRTKRTAVEGGVSERGGPINAAVTVDACSACANPQKNDYRDAEATGHRTYIVVPRSLDQVNLFVETVNRTFAFQRSVLLAHSARNRHTFELSRSVERNSHAVPKASTRRAVILIGASRHSARSIPHPPVKLMSGVLAAFTLRALSNLSSVASSQVSPSPMPLAALNSCNARREP
jgi:hypothetical protein